MRCFVRGSEGDRSVDTASRGNYSANRRVTRDVTTFQRQPPARGPHCARLSEPEGRQRGEIMEAEASSVAADDHQRIPPI